ncbi:centrosomal protein of 112 kDa isoform X1 [Petromyzon marinus]|uniref:centrosomal protein of 112 kDa isoform X1 n=1 Tax=Petromyzon marinus TaxID=7757 RepID=UPI003F722116
MQMESHEDACEKLDGDFDHFLVDMKPFVLKLPHKSDRQRCALWIKKLCEPPVARSGALGISSRKNRNDYARLLLHMLRRSVLEEPFTHRPDTGPLKTLPTYMAIYFDEPLEDIVASREPPDWVTGALDAPEETSKRSLKEDERSGPHLSFDSTCSRHRTSSENEGASRQLHALSQSAALGPVLKRSFKRTQDHHTGLSSDDSDLDSRFGAGDERNGTFLDQQTVSQMHKKELEVRTKLLEVMFQEEKLKLQQKHDADIQKILDRKNGEIEEVKSLNRRKQKEADDTIKKLEKKVQALMWEAQVLQESKDREMVDLARTSEHNIEDLRSQYESKLTEATSDFEVEKLQLQKRHTDNIQALLDDTNTRLAAMEDEYSSQARATVEQTRELESRVQQLSIEAERNSSLGQRLGQEKAQLEAQCSTLSSELEYSKSRYASLEQESQRARLVLEEKLQQCRGRLEAQLESLKQDNARAASEATAVIEGLEKEVSEHKGSLRETELQKHRQLREQENQFKQQIIELEQLSDKKIRSVQTELEETKAEAQRKIRQMEDGIREKEERHTRALEAERAHAQRAEAALDDFKKQVELNAEKIYGEMRHQMTKVESDLSRSKSLREKQAKEFTRQQEQLRQRYEQQIVELRLQQEQDKTLALQHHGADKERLLKLHQEEMESLEARLRATAMEQESHFQERRKRDAKTVSELERRLSNVAVQQEAERQRASRELEAAHAKFRFQLENARVEMQRAHSKQMEQAQEKASARFRQMEKECNQRLAASAQAMAEVQTNTATLKDEASRRQLTLERQLNEAHAQRDAEKRTLLEEHGRETQVDSASNK